MATVYSSICLYIVLISFNNVLPLSMYIFFIDFQFDISWCFFCLFNIFSSFTYLAVTGLNGGIQSSTFIVACGIFGCGMWDLVPDQG